MGLTANKWLARAGKVMVEQGGLKTSKPKPKDPVEAVPAIGGADGVYFGIMDKNMTPLARDSGTESAMKAVGIEKLDETWTQIRFSRPAMYKGIMNCVSAVLATNEPVLTFIAEQHSTHDLYLMKMAPMEEDKIMWVCIDIQRSSSAVLNNFGPDISQFLGNIDQVV